MINVRLHASCNGGHLLFSYRVVDLCYIYNERLIVEVTFFVKLWLFLFNLAFLGVGGVKLAKSILVFSITIHVLTYCIKVIVWTFYSLWLGY